MEVPRETPLSQMAKLGRAILVLMLIGVGWWSMVSHQHYLNRVGRPHWKQVAAEVDAIIAGVGGESSEAPQVTKGQATVLIMEGVFHRPAGPIAPVDMDRALATGGWVPARRTRADRRMYCKGSLVADLKERPGARADYSVVVQWGSADVMCPE